VFAGDKVDVVSFLYQIMCHRTARDFVPPVVALRMATCFIQMPSDPVGRLNRSCTAEGAGS